MIKILSTIITTENLVAGRNCFCHIKNIFLRKNMCVSTYKNIQLGENICILYKTNILLRENICLSPKNICSFWPGQKVCSLEHLNYQLPPVCPVLHGQARQTCEQLCCYAWQRYQWQTAPSVTVCNIETNVSSSDGPSRIMQYSVLIFLECWGNNRELCKAITDIITQADFQCHYHYPTN